MPQLVIGSPTVDAHSCSSVTDLASKMETILTAMGDPALDPGDGSGIPVEQPYIIRVCLDENTNFVNGQAAGRVTDSEGNIVEGLAPVTISDPTGGALEGMGAGECFAFIASVDTITNPDGTTTTVIEVVIGGGDTGGGDSGTSGGSAVAEFEIIGDDPFLYEDTDVQARPVSTGGTFLDTAAPVTLYDYDEKWTGLPAYNGINDTDERGYRFIAQKFYEDPGGGNERWKIISGEYPAPTLILRSTFDAGKYVVELDEPLGMSAPLGRMPLKDDDPNFDIEAFDPLGFTDGTADSIYTATWAADRQGYVITSKKQQSTSNEIGIATDPIKKMEAIVGENELILGAKERVNLVDFERIESGYIIPTTKLDSFSSGTTRTALAINLSSTEIRASPTEPIVLSGFVRYITNDDGDTEEVFIITNVTDLRCLPGFAIGIEPPGEDDGHLQIPYHPGGKREFQLDSEQCFREEIETN